MKRIKRSVGDKVKIGDDTTILIEKVSIKDKGDKKDTVVQLGIIAPKDKKID